MPDAADIRKANDNIAAVARRVDDSEQWDFVCECGRCDGTAIGLRLSEFDAMRRNGGIIAPGHAG